MAALRLHSRPGLPANESTACDAIRRSDVDGTTRKGQRRNLGMPHRILTGTWTARECHSTFAANRMEPLRQDTARHRHRRSGRGGHRRGRTQQHTGEIRHPRQRTTYRNLQRNVRSHTRGSQHGRRHPTRMEIHRLRYGQRGRGRTPTPLAHDGSLSLLRTAGIQSVLPTCTEQPRTARIAINGMEHGMENQSMGTSTQSRQLCCNPQARTEAQHKLRH